MEKNDQPLLKTFKIYPTNEQISRHRLHIPKQATREPHLIHQLDIQYHYTTWRFNPLRSTKLLKPYKKLKRIDSFFLFLYQMSKQDDAISQNLSLKLKSLSSLQTLNLNFSHGQWLSLKETTRLSHALGELKNLSKLTLCLSSCLELDDECFYVLFQALKKHKKLKYFDLDFSNCRKIKEKTFKDLASVLKRSLQSLEEFSFAMSDLFLTKGKSLDLLDSGLASLSSLKKLKLSMTNVKISPENDCLSFTSSIQHLKSLRMLDLDLSSLHKSPTLLQRFATNLRSFINLHTLSLNFRSAETSFVQEMEVIAQGLQELTTLENLTLNFSDSLNLHDQALEKLAAGVKTFIKLSNFILVCNQCPHVGDVGIESVINELENLPSLKSVNLFFLYCGPIKADYKLRLLKNKNQENIFFNLKF